MKKIFFILAFTAVFTGMFSQSTIKEGPVIELPKGSSPAKVIGGDDKSFYTLLVKGDGDAYYLEKYAVDALTKEFSVLLPAQNSETYMDEFFDGERVFLFRAVFNKQELSFSLMMDVVKKNGAFEQQNVLVKKINVKYNFNVPNCFLLTMSQDNKYIAVVSADNYIDENASRPTELTVYETHPFSKKYTKNIPGAFISNIKIDNNGDVFCLRGSDIEMFKKETDKVERVVLAEKGQKLESAQFCIDAGTIVAAGFQKSEGAVYSVFTKTINLATKAEILDVNPFPENMKKMLNCLGSTLPENFRMAAIQLKKINDDYYFLGEEQSKRFFMERNQSVYTYYSTIAVKIAPGNKIEWIRVLPKKYNSFDKYNVDSEHFLSFSANGELRVIQLQSPANRTVDIKDYDVTALKSVLGANGCDAMVYSFKTTGEVKAEVLIEKIDDGLQIQPCVREKDNRFHTDNIVYTWKNNNILFFNNDKKPTFVHLLLQ